MNVRIVFVVVFECSLKKYYLHRNKKNTNLASYFSVLYFLLHLMKDNCEKTLSDNLHLSARNILPADENIRSTGPDDAGNDK